MARPTRRKMFGAMTALAMLGGSESGACSRETRSDTAARGDDRSGQGKARIIGENIAPSADSAPEDIVLNTGGARDETVPPDAGAGEGARHADVTRDVEARAIDNTRPGKAPLLTLTVAVAAAQLDGQRVVSDAWIDGQWAAVDRLYADFGIRFERRWVNPLPETSARLETKEDRDALGNYFVEGAVNVFFVKRLLDIDEIGRIRMGVCWRAPANKRFVAVASNAKPTVLAHELGHFLGNGHSKVVDNVMSYDRTGGPVFFDANQKKTMRATALQLLSDDVVKAGQP